MQSGKTLKAFVVGMPKAGTSTLQNALVKSGLASAHWKDQRTDKYVGHCLYKRFFAGQNLMQDFADKDIVTQADLITMETSYWPQMDAALLREIARQNPGCQFILNHRDPAKTAGSIERWGNMMERLYLKGAPGLPPRMAKSRQAIQLWIENHHANTRALFEGNPDFWEYDIEDPDAPQKVSKKLGVEIKWWGHSNQNTSGRLGFVKSQDKPLLGG